MFFIRISMDLTKLRYEEQFHGLNVVSYKQVSLKLMVTTFV